MKPPHQVLMTADSVGGVWTYAMELCRALSDQGVHVAIATMGPRPSPSQRAEAKRIRGVSLFESAYDLEWMDNPWHQVDRAGEWLLELEHQIRPDIVHLNGYVHGSLPWKAPVVCVAHSCVYSWWRAVHGEDPPAHWQRYRDRVRAGLEGASEIVAVSRTMAQAIQRSYGIQVESVVYNGRSWPSQDTMPKEPFVFSSGRLWDEAKNIATVESAAALMSWPVYVAGSTRHPNGGASTLRSCVGLGQLSEQQMQTWYSKSSIYVLPAKYEPFGLSALEAALSGCALVLGDIPSLREIWGDAALYVPPSDAEALALAVNALSARPEMLKLLAWRAHSRATRFTTARMGDGYLRVYEQAGRRGEGTQAKCAS